MSEQIANNELRNRFNTVWANRIPVAWPNALFTPPNPSAPWCRFTVTGGDGEQLTIGASTNAHRYSGIIYISIFVPQDTGDAVALQRADEAAAIFRNWCGTNITCRDSKIKVIGNTSDGWYQVNCMIPYLRDELL